LDDDRSGGDGSVGKRSGAYGSGEDRSGGDGSGKNGLVGDGSVGNGSVVTKVAADPPSFNWFLVRILDNKDNPNQAPGQSNFDVTRFKNFIVGTNQPMKRVIEVLARA
jgi:hypothetical protein